MPARDDTTMTNDGPPEQPYPQQPYPQQPYPQQPYGQQPPAYGQPQAPYGYAPPAYPYAHWIRRVAAYLLDGLFTNLTSIPAIALVGVGIGIGSQDMETYTDQYGYTQTTGDWNSSGTPLVVIGAVLFLLPVAFFVWNFCLRQGRTGQTLGKSILGITLIGERTGQPVGAGLSFVRYLCHIVDSLPCYIGYFWPLWDAKRQTFADKIMSTVVVEKPRP
jgi:uncharacterized RDD family membrane protein YckC